MDYSLRDKNQFYSAFKKVCKKLGFKENKEKPLLSMSNGGGKYYLEFSKFSLVNFFNKIATTKKLMTSKYYPKSWILKSKGEMERLKLRDKYYFVKPMYGWACETISLMRGKRLLIDNGVRYPCVVQEEVVPRLVGGYKVDYRVYVLYVREGGRVGVYYYPVGMIRRCKEKFREKKTAGNMLTYQGSYEYLDPVDVRGERMEECLREVNGFIVGKMGGVGEGRMEFEVAGYDVIEDGGGKYWVLEVNSGSGFFQHEKYMEFQTELIEDIIYNILLYEYKGQIDFQRFIKIF